VKNVHRGFRGKYKYFKGKIYFSWARGNILYSAVKYRGKSLGGEGKIKNDNNARLSFVGMKNQLAINKSLVRNNRTVLLACTLMSQLYKTCNINRGSA
jgi:hypothetical protein